MRHAAAAPVITSAASGSTAPSPSRPPWNAGTTTTFGGRPQTGSVTASASGTTANQRIDLPLAPATALKYLAPNSLTELSRCCAPPGPYGDMPPTRWFSVSRAYPDTDLPSGPRV